jgi:hypothetical protein
MEKQTNKNNIQNFSRKSHITKPLGRVIFFPEKALDFITGQCIRQKGGCKVIYYTGLLRNEVKCDLRFSDNFDFRKLG